MTCAYPSIVTPHGEVLHSGRYDHELHDGDLLLADVGAETTGGWAGDVTRTWPVSGRFSSTQRELYEVVLEAQRRAIAAVTAGTRYRNVHLLAAQALASGLVDLGILRGNPIELCADGVVALLFPHGIGHLLGLDVHDMEDLGDRAGYAPGRERAKEFGMRALRLDRDLLPGMAVTIEPGIYISTDALAALSDTPRNRAFIAAVRPMVERYNYTGVRIEDDYVITPNGLERMSSAPREIDEIESVMAKAKAK